MSPTYLITCRAQAGQEFTRSFPSMTAREIFKLNAAKCSLPPTVVKEWLAEDPDVPEIHSDEWGV